jgi:hypothetical protein
MLLHQPLATQQLLKPGLLFPLLFYVAASVTAAQRPGACDHQPRQTNEDFYSIQQSHLQGILPQPLCQLVIIKPSCCATITTILVITTLRGCPQVLKVSTRCGNKQQQQQQQQQCC